MGSSGKKRTTMAKLNRESKLRDKRADKEARKTARKMTAANGPAPESSWDEDGIALDGEEPSTSEDGDVTAEADTSLPAASA